MTDRLIVRRGYILSQLFLIRMSLSKPIIILIVIIIITIVIYAKKCWGDFDQCGGDFEIGANLLNVGTILHWGDLTRYPTWYEPSNQNIGFYREG